MEQTITGLFLLGGMGVFVLCLTTLHKQHTVLLPSFNFIAPHHWPLQEQPQNTGYGLDDKKTLVILYGQPRGGIYAWKSLQKHVLVPLNAHLATYFTDDCPSTELDTITTYRWLTHAHQDWEVVLAAAAKSCTPAALDKDWKKLYEIKNQFLGGIIASNQLGSGGIMLAFRWLVMQKILELNLQATYDFMVLSRADQLHLRDHVPVTLAKEGYVIVPDGEAYGGWTDRHLFARTPDFMRAINITQELVCNAEKWHSILKATKKTYNPESIQKTVWDETGLQVTVVKRCMLMVRASHDPTRWSQGEEHPLVQLFDLRVKYITELELVLSQCVNELDFVKEMQTLQAYRLIPK